MRAGIPWMVSVALCILCSRAAVAQTIPNESNTARAEQPSPSDDFGGPQISDSGVGYIDCALLGDQIRFRFDAAYNNVQPARAEFFWPVDAAFGPGPGPETRVDYQDLSLYAERRIAYQWSVFGEIPVRMLNGEIQDNTTGLGDMNVGVKYLLGSSCDSVVTFQFRGILPTGAGTRGLGTEHVSLEPALLMFHRYSDRLAFEAEVRDWISVNGSEGFAGNVLRYGIGGMYTFNPCDCRPLSAVVEFVGWTVLDGGTAVTTPPVTVFADATGDTIVNAKLGLRCRLSYLDSIYAGYGRALTSEQWYEDVFRFEYRHAF